MWARTDVKIKIEARMLKRGEILPFHFFRDKIDPTS